MSDGNIKVTWALLTWNRAGTVIKAVPYCMENAGSKWGEMVWVDNGSLPNERGAILASLERENEPLTVVMNHTNLGVDKGYNRAIALASCEWIVITGCDREMPKNWLKIMKEIISADPTVKVISVYAHHISKCPERRRGADFEIAGHKVCSAMPFGARIFHRDLLKKAGYFREDFGLYGWSDLEFAERQMRVCNENGWKYVALLDQYANHLGDEGSNEYKGCDPHEYWKFKQEQVKDPKKHEVLQRCKEEGYKYYSPW